MAELGQVDLTTLDAAIIAPASAKRLADRIRADLLVRHGFTLLKGFPVEELDRQSTARAFLLFGGLVGSPRSQNAAGHLLGLWLALPGDRPLPAVFAQRYGSVEVGERGGIIVADTELCVPLDV